MNQLSVINQDTGESQSFINYLDTIAKSDLIFDLAIKDRCSLYKQVQQIEATLRIIKQYVQLSFDSDFNDNQTKLVLDDITINKVKGKMKEGNVYGDDGVEYILKQFGYDKDSELLKKLTIEDLGRYKFELQWTKVKKLISKGYEKLSKMFYQENDYYKIEIKKESDVPTPF